MKKFYPYIFVFISIILAVILFDYIKLPYDENNIIQGSAFIKRINPYNNLLKVYFFILFPLSVFLISYLYTHNALGIVPFKKNFFLNINNCNSNIFKHENKKINFFTFFLIFFLILEFLSLDFSILLSPIDIYHDGLILVPSYNSLFFKDYWISTHFDYGVGANLRPLLIWKITGLETIGSARFLDQLIILLNKIILIFISRKISLLLQKKNIYKLVFFILLSISSSQLSDYFVSLHSSGGSPLPLRTFFFLIFFLFLIFNFEKKNVYIKDFLLGYFSSLSFLWYNDFAFYTNIILCFYILVLIFVKEFKKVLIIILGTAISWLLIFFYFGIVELNELFFQIKSNMQFIYYFNFLEFPKPFSSDFGSSKAIKSLLLIIVNGIICIHLCLNKNIKNTYEIKMLLIMAFISSVVLFKSALIRSDIYHIKYASGFIFFLSILNFYLIFFYRFEFNKKVFKFIKLNNHYYSIILIIVVSSIFMLKNDLNSMQRLISFKQDIKFILHKNDDFYLNFKSGMWNYGRKYSATDLDEDRKFITYYKNLTINDKCIQNFTEYLALSYFLKKPTCTKFYNTQFIQHKINDHNFIAQFKTNLPNYILYSSPIIHLDRFGNIQQNSLLNGIPRVDEFIKNNYYFYESYLGKWLIYKKKFNN